MGNTANASILILLALTTFFVYYDVTRQTQTATDPPTIISDPPTSTPAPQTFMFGDPPTSTPTPIQTVGVSIYSDAALTTPMSAVTWGNLAPGGQTTVTIFIKNTGNTQETLSMATNTYTPSNANTYLTCTWTPTVTTLSAGASTSATLTLAASSSATAGSFNFNISITGTG